MTINILNWETCFVEPPGGGTAGQAVGVGFWKIQFLVLSRLKQIPATIKESCQCKQGYLTPWCKHQQSYWLPRWGILTLVIPLTNYAGEVPQIMQTATVHLCQRSCHLTWGRCRLSTLLVCSTKVTTFHKNYTTASCWLIFMKGLFLRIFSHR